jgi:hypothetical protein
MTKKQPLFEKQTSLTKCVNIELLRIEKYTKTIQEIHYKRDPDTLL